MAQPRNRGSSYLQSIGQNDPDRKTPGHDWILLEWLSKERVLEFSKQWFTVPTWETGTIAALRLRANKTVADYISEREFELKRQKNALDRLMGQTERSRYETNTPDAQRRVIRSIEDQIEQAKSWSGLGEPPAPALEITRINDAHPVYDGARSLRPAIYIDRLVNFKCACSLDLIEDWTPNLLSERKCSKFLMWGIRYDQYNVAFEAKTSIPSYSELIQQLQTYRGFLPRTKIVVVCPDDQFKVAVEDQGFEFIKCPEPPKAPAAQSLLF